MQIMEDDIRFVIVTFLEERNAPGIVASNWIKKDGKTCFYPNVRTEEMKEKLLRKMAAPDHMWQQYKIKILKGYETYGDARLHLRKAEETSDLDSDEEVKKRNRKRKINVYLPEDSDDSSDVEKDPLSTKRKTDFSRCPSPPKPKANSSNSIVRGPPNPTVMHSSPIASSSHSHSSVDSPAVSSQPKMCPSDCATSKLVIQQSHLIQMMTDLTKQVSEINKKMDLILGQPEEPSTPRRQDPYSMPEFLTNLPVNDDDSFCNLNEQLKNSDNKLAMIQFLTGIGGKNLRSFATNILRRILLDKVAEQYSLTGKRMKNSNKKSFIDTETFQLIFQMCKNMHGTATDDKLKEIIGDWLNQAKVRLSRRAERRKKIKHEESLV